MGWQSSALTPRRSVQAGGTAISAEIKATWNAGRALQLPLRRDCAALSAPPCCPDTDIPPAATCPDVHPGCGLSPRGVGLQLSRRPQGKNAAPAAESNHSVPMGSHKSAPGSQPPMSPSKKPGLRAGELPRAPRAVRRVTPKLGCSCGNGAPPALIGGGWRWGAAPLQLWGRGGAPRGCRAGHEAVRLRGFGSRAKQRGGSDLG